MNNTLQIGRTIKKQRLALDLRMDDVSRLTGISRVTLSSIESGKGNCSITNLLKICDCLGLTFGFSCGPEHHKRKSRASRINTVSDKKVNRFIVMCVEQYAKQTEQRSKDVYKTMEKAGVINELKTDYEDLHGMSFVYINNFIDEMIKGARL